MNEGAPEGKPQYTEAERIDEERRVRHLRRLVDFSLALVAQTDLAREEASELWEAVRAKALELFPDKGETFELIYTPRFRRLLAEKYGLH